MKRCFYLLIMVLCVSVMASHAQGLKMVQNTVSATPIGQLDDRVSGSSTLFCWQGQLWTCNDHGNLVLYAVDTLTAQITSTLDLGCTIADMEEVTQDDNYLYFGDFGNNRGDALRTDLRILRLSKAALLTGDICFDTIVFVYPNYPAQGKANDTDFDCEAMLVHEGTIYLFTKQWLSLQTVCYTVPNEPGSYTASPQFRLNVGGLITGVSYRQEDHTVVFCGYNSVCQPFVYLCYDFVDMDLVGGSSIRLDLDCGLGTQIEGIATADGRNYYLSSERFSSMGVTRDPQLFKIDLNEYLPSRNEQQCVEENGIMSVWVFPNPTNRWIEIRYPQGIVCSLVLTDASGHELLRQPGSDGRSRIDLAPFSAGVYCVRLEFGDGRYRNYTIVKQP